MLHSGQAKVRRRRSPRDGRMLVAACGAVVLCWLAPRSSAGATSFDEIEFWTGEGSQRAALVVDWSEDALDGPSLVWGFRFDETSSGADMVKAVLRADARLYAKLYQPGQDEDLGLAVNGLGYDWNGDAALPLSEEAPFDASGIARVDSPSDFVTAATDEDVYAEGWFAAGFWTYATAPSNPFAGESTWENSQFGASARMLADGHWDAWTFAPSFLPGVPDAPLPAPMESIPGDYDRDYYVGGGDLLLWQRTYAAPVAPPGAGADGNRSGEIDGGDLALWRREFGDSALPTTHASQPTLTAEPTTGRLVWSVVLLPLLKLARRRRQASRAKSIR